MTLKSIVKSFETWLEHTKEYRDDDEIVEQVEFILKKIQGGTWKINK